MTSEVEYSQAAEGSTQRPTAADVRCVTASRHVGAGGEVQARVEPTHVPDAPHASFSVHASLSEHEAPMSGWY